MHKTNHPNTKHYWFQYNFCYCSMRITAPSTYWSGSFQYNFCYCSMKIWESNNGWDYMFQYNFCYCSIKQVGVRQVISQRFNTTFVTVLFTAKKVQKRTYGFQYNFCYCSIGESIWNYPAVIPFQYNFCYCSIKAIEPFYVPVTLFQYNFCYCSIQTESHRHTIHNRFNTTFVTVLSGITSK